MSSSWVRDSSTYTGRGTPGRSVSAVPERWRRETTAETSLLCVFFPPPSSHRCFPSVFIPWQSLRPWSSRSRSRKPPVLRRNQGNRTLQSFWTCGTRQPAADVLTSWDSVLFGGSQVACRGRQSGACFSRTGRRHEWKSAVAFLGDGAALEWTSVGRDLSLPGSRCWRLCGESVTSRGLQLLSVACSLPVLNDSHLIASSSHRATEIIVCMHPCLSEQARVPVLCGASGSPGECSWNLILTPECDRLATFFVCKMKKKKVRFSP